MSLWGIVNVGTDPDLMTSNHLIFRHDKTLLYVYIYIYNPLDDICFEIIYTVNLEQVYK